MQGFQSQVVPLKYNTYAVWKRFSIYKVRLGIKSYYYKGVIGGFHLVDLIITEFKSQMHCKYVQLNYSGSALKKL